MKKILILEEGKYISEMIRQNFLDEEYEIISVNNRVLFYKKHQGLIPDLIIADLTLIQNQNVELLVQLKSNPVISLFPFLLITSGNSSNSDELSSGLNYYLSKPYSNEDFFQLLKKIFEESKRLSPW
jgi:response regulator RpfG family c-di-GMP phosphodiesterase